jgi:gamma-glutamyl hydrolase
MDYATYQNDQGNVYPVWATCLGYETVMYLYGNQKDNMTILTQVYGQDGLTCPLKIITGVSDILQSLPSNVLEKATSNDGLYYFHHTWAVLASTYYQNPGINSFWKLVTTSFTKDKV